MVSKLATQDEVVLGTPGPPAIDVEDVSVSYRVRVARTSMWADLKAVTTRRTRDRIVPALQDVSFSVPRGDVLAIIGRNGAGKSTLLRTISGGLAPDRGRVTVRGRISLLSLGIGFDRDLTGRENIKLGGLAIGLEPDRLREITDEIVSFAQLGEYVNYPMRTYSNGMRGRLAFSIAAFLDPEILLIDEALAGGDAAFGQRASEKMAELCGRGRTIILVTHGLTYVQAMATRAIWLHAGRIAEEGEKAEVLASYMRYCRLENLELPDD